MAKNSGNRDIARNIGHDVTLPSSVQSSTGNNLYTGNMSAPNVPVMSSISDAVQLYFLQQPQSQLNRSSAGQVVLPPAHIVPSVTLTRRNDNLNTSMDSSATDAFETLPDEFKCTNCLDTFHSTSDKMFHDCSLTHEPFACCGKPFKTRKGIFEHRKKNHTNHLLSEFMRRRETANALRNNSMAAILNGGNGGGGRTSRVRVETQGSAGNNYCENCRVNHTDESRYRNHICQPKGAPPYPCCNYHYKTLHGYQKHRSKLHQA